MAKETPNEPGKSSWKTQTWPMLLCLNESHYIYNARKCIGTGCVADMSAIHTPSDIVELSWKVAFSKHWPLTFARVNNLTVTRLKYQWPNVYPNRRSMESRKNSEKLFRCQHKSSTHFHNITSYQCAHARKECNKYDLTAHPCFLLANHNDDWSRWFAISSSHVFTVPVSPSSWVRLFNDHIHSRKC